MTDRTPSILLQGAKGFMPLVDSTSGRLHADLICLVCRHATKEAMQYLSAIDPSMI